MVSYKEEAVAGTRFGLIEKMKLLPGRQGIFFKNRILRVKIAEMIKPQMFTDEQLQGDFREMKHEHHFKPCDNGTILIDLFHYESPYGLVGEWFNSLYPYKIYASFVRKRTKL
ncbi:MAG: cell division protein [Chitinophagaceae bacterium]|nr:cell division protein [Chitinophagaceae bacterium]